MIDVIMIAIAAVIVAGIGCTFINAYSKWKKVMKDTEAEGGESDVSE